MGGMKEVTDGIWAEFNRLNNEIIKANTAYFCKLQEADKLYGQLVYERKSRSDLEAENTRLLKDLAAVTKERDELREDVENWRIATSDDAKAEGEDGAIDLEKNLRSAFNVIASRYAGEKTPPLDTFIFNSAFYSFLALVDEIEAEEACAVLRSKFNG